MGKYLKTVLSIVLALAVLTSCAMPAGEGKRDYDEDKIDGQVIGGMTSFAFELFKELNREEGGGNIFISPLSVSTALTMTYNGAGGETRNEMKESLGYGDVSDEKTNG